jgi:hypothetical protein
MGWVAVEKANRVVVSRLGLPSVDGFWLEHKSHFKFGLVAVAVGVDL